jgi:uncharacterized protein
MTEDMNRMSRGDCLAGLTGETVGRVAATSQAMPVIIPVNYVLHGNAVIFRTKPDGLLARACDGNIVAFEVDVVSPDGFGGWSVLVVGRARLLSGREETEAAQLGLVSAVGGGRDQFVRIDFGRVSGRRIGSAAVPDELPPQIIRTLSGAS